MGDQLKAWLEEQNQVLLDNRNQMESDRLLLQGRHEAVQAVLGKIYEIENENTKPEGQAEEEQPSSEETAVNE